MSPLFSEDLQTLYPLEMEEWGRVMEPALQKNHPQILTGEVTDWAPKIQKFIAKNNVTANRDSTLHDHDFILNELEQQPNGLTQKNSISYDIDLSTEFQGIESECPPTSETFAAKDVTTLETTNVIGEFTLDVVNQLAPEAKDIHVIVLPFSEKSGIAKEWFLFPEDQQEEEDLTGHNPLLVTGQVMSQVKKRLNGPIATITVPTILHESPYPQSGEEDLLSMVDDDNIKSDSKRFKNYVKVDNRSVITAKDVMEILSSTPSSPSSSTSGEFEKQQIELKPETEKCQKIVKRGRGRPRLLKTEPEAPKRPRGRPATAPEWVDVENYGSSSSMSSDELQDVRYRRMRDLNNAASKRCRNNRKRKFQNEEGEITLLAAKNMELKGILGDLESQVKKFKSALDLIINKNKKQQVEKPSTITNSSLATTSQSDPCEIEFEFEKLKPEDLTFLDILET